MHPGYTMQAMPEHTTAYLDRAGRPLLRQSVVAFFDILGFSEASTSNATAIDSQHVLDKIVAAIEDSRDFVRQSFPDSELAKAGHWGIKFFSDNLAFGYPFDSNIADPATTVWFIIRCAALPVSNGFEWIFRARRPDARPDLFDR